jgi:hypothetical protein
MFNPGQQDWVPALPVSQALCVRQVPLTQAKAPDRIRAMPAPVRPNSVGSLDRYVVVGKTSENVFFLPTNSKFLMLCSPK